MRTKIVKITALIGILLSMFYGFIPSYADTFQETIINTFKAHPKVIEIIKNKEAAGYDLKFYQVRLSEQCGVRGCTWKKLVIMNVSSPRGEVNPRTKSIMAIVSGINAKKEKTKIDSFVDFKVIDEGQIN